MVALVMERVRFSPGTAHVAAVAARALILIVAVGAVVLLVAPVMSVGLAPRGDAAHRRPHAIVAATTALLMVGAAGLSRAAAQHLVDDFLHR